MGLSRGTDWQGEHLPERGNPLHGGGQRSHGSSMRSWPSRRWGSKFIRRLGEALLERDVYASGNCGGGALGVGDPDGRAMRYWQSGTVRSSSSASGRLGVMRPVAGGPCRSVSLYMTAVRQLCTRAMLSSTLADWSRPAMSAEVVEGSQTVRHATERSTP